MALRPPDVGDDGDDREKGRPPSQQLPDCEKNIGPCARGNFLLFMESIHSPPYAWVRNSLHPPNVQPTIRKGDSTAVCVDAKDFQVLQLLQFPRIFHPPY
jgi:hypothetical protein